MNLFGDKLKQFAKGKYNGVGHLASTMGIKQPQLSAYITGKQEPGLKIFKKLYKVECDILWLLNDEDKRNYNELVINTVSEPEEKYESTSFNLEHQLNIYKVVVDFLITVLANRDSIIKEIEKDLTDSSIVNSKELYNKIQNLKKKDELKYYEKDFI